MRGVEGLFIRTLDGTEGYVLAVELGSYTVALGVPTRTVGFVGLIKKLDGTLTSVPLEGATIGPVQVLVCFCRLCWRTQIQPEFGKLQPAKKTTGELQHDADVAEGCP